MSKATPGPWDWSGGHTEDPDIGFVVHGHMPWEQFGMPDGTYKLPDADFIAHAREDIPWLLARVRALEAALAEYANSDNWDYAEDSAAGYLYGEGAEPWARARTVLAGE